MKKAIIIDDEPLAISIVKEYLQDYPDIEVVDECLNGFEALKSIQDNQPDLIFLDIQMPKITGFELLELLDEPPAIIFTTAYEEYAIKAFEAHAVDYLLKPFNKDRFASAISNIPDKNDKNDKQKIAEMSSEAATPLNNRIVVKVGSNIRIIAISEIYCLEAYDDYVKIHTENDTFLKKQTLSNLENMLPDTHFLRVHRSFLPAIQFIVKIEQNGKDSHTALLKNDFKVPLSRKGYASLKEMLGI